MAFLRITVITLLSLHAASVYCFPLQVDVDANGSATSFGTSLSNSAFGSEAGVLNGNGFFSAGGKGKGLSLTGGPSDAFVSARGKITENGLLTAGGSVDSGASSFGNLGSGSKAESQIGSSAGFVQGGGDSTAWGTGLGIAAAESGSRTRAVDRFGLRSAAAAGSATGQGGLVNVLSSSGSRLGIVGTGALSNNAASATGRGRAKVAASSSVANFKRF